MSKKTLIYYNSIISFLFWIIKDTTLHKESEIFQKDKKTYIKTNKYQGKIFSLNFYFVLIIKYFIPILISFMLFVFSNNIIEAYFIYGFPIVLLFIYFFLFLKDKGYRIFTIIFSSLYFLLSTLIFIKYNLPIFFILQLFFNSLHIFLCYLIFFKIYKDYSINKNRMFYFDKFNRLIISKNK